MKITKIESFIVKLPFHETFGAGTSTPTPVLYPESNYYRAPEAVYSQLVETVLVRVETDEGLYGWGEGQAPVGPEVPQTIIDRMLAPVLLGCDPTQTSVLWDRMYTSMNVRGQITGFMLDAISALDIALWDIKGKAAGMSVASLLGGSFRTKLPIYVSGMRAENTQARAELAESFFAGGFSGVKLFLGISPERDIAEATAVRNRVGDGKRVFCDLYWRYGLPEAERIGRVFEELQIGWMEAPLAPEDVGGHAKLAQNLQIAIAIGEPLRTRYQFLDWFECRALDVAQPDIARCGITEGKRIADLASAWHLPVAFHMGITLGVGIAATWQVAAAIPNLYIIEFQPPEFELAARFLTEPLKVENGQAVLPSGPGLGIDIDVTALRGHIREEG